MDSADVEWGLRPEIRIEGIQVTRASQPGFQADRVALKLSPHKLAAAGLGILSLEVVGARIALGEGGGAPARDEPAENVVGWVLWLLGSILITDSEVTGGTEEGTWSLLLHEAGLNVRLDGSTGLRVHAAFQDMPLSFSGSVGGMSEIVSGQTVPLELSGHVGNRSNQVTISGRIHDVLQGRGLDLRVRADLVSLEGLPLAAKSGFPALTGEAHVVQEGAFDSMQLREVDIRSSGFGLGLRIHGEVGRVRNWQDVSLEVALNGSVTEPGILQMPHVGGRMEVDVRGSVSGAAGTMELVLSRGRVLTREIIAEISGTIGSPLGDWKTPAKLGLRMQPEASIIPGSLRALPPLSAEADLYWKSGRLETSNLWIRGGSSETGDIWLLGEGALHGIGRDLSGAVSLSGSLDGMALEKLTGSDRLSDASLIAQAEWSVEKGISRVDHIELKGSAPGLALSGTGSYPEPARPESLRMRLEVSGDSLGRLAGLLNTDLPQVGRFAGSAELAGSAEGLFRLENLALSVEDEALTAEVSGGLALTGPDLPLDLAFRSEIADPSLLKYYLGDLGILDEIGFLFPLSARGTLLASAGPSGERRYTLEGLEVNSLSGTHDVKATGHVSAFNTPDRSGAVELLLSGSVSAEQDDRFQDWTGRLPFLKGNLEARTRVEIHPDRVEVGDLDLSIQGNRFSVSAQGTLESMDPFHVKRMTVRFSGDTLDDLYSFSDPGLNTDNPVRGELAIIGEDSGQRLDLDLSIAGDDLTASLRLEAAENDPARRRISGRISARSLDLTRILQPPEKTDQVFSSDPIGLAWAGLADMDLEIDIENFRNRVLELRRLEGSIRTLDGSMEVQASGLSDTRPLNLQVNLDRRQDRWESRVRLHGEGVDMRMLPDLLAHQTRGGTFSVDLDLSGSGRRSPRWPQRRMDRYTLTWTMPGSGAEICAC